MFELLSAFWLQHTPFFSVLLPALTAVLLILVGDPRSDHISQRRIKLQRVLSFGSALLGLGMAILLIAQAHQGRLISYAMGEWHAPFGINLVLDRLSALLLLLTYVVAVPALAYACCGWDRRGRYFHAMFQFQLMGLAGAFLTGDLFNLFVFFEILLLASYVLLVHGQGARRFRMGVHYVVLNLSASALFLVGLGLIYGVTGTLNMTDVALKVAALTGDQAVLARAAAAVLLVVFGLKAALVPLYFWLPNTYAAASAPVAALFAIMTKVGVYSIIRVHGLIFGVDAGESALAVAPWLLPLALLTSLLGILGALAAHTLKRLVAYLTVSSVGTILVAVSLFTPSSLSAALYYLMHSTVVIAGLFLFVELIAKQRGGTQDTLQPALRVREPVLLGFLMLLGAASVAGLPPLPGFLGKLMILESASGLDAHAVVWSVVLIVGILGIIGLARAGVILFWHVPPDTQPDQEMPPSNRVLISMTLLLLSLGFFMAAFASPIKQYMDATATQLYDRSTYAQVVLGLSAQASDSSSTQLYQGIPPTTIPQKYQQSTEVQITP
ncbi:MAG: monovalent cation/H+ antiporter subunit D [Pseudomonadota bacterium]|nr:monovalent cation/H+ antiporter subunit D [Pseudomonadota bacterium]